jgi:hypothetical protein
MGLTHYRGAFDSPYLSSADIVGPTVLTIKHVRQEAHKTEQHTKPFNVAYFLEGEIRPGEKLKPMILNATNCKTLVKMSGSKYIDHWKDLEVVIYVDNNVIMNGEVVEGLRISPELPQKKELTPSMKKAWRNAKHVYKKFGNLKGVKKRYSLEQLLMSECSE